MMIKRFEAAQSHMRVGGLDLPRRILNTLPRP